MTFCTSKTILIHSYKIQSTVNGLGTGAFLINSNSKLEMLDSNFGTSDSGLTVDR
jgi:hypothetical protein